MSIDAQRSGKIEYPSEGFSVHWNRRGLEIQVTEYHAGILKLSWGTLLDLASKAAGDSSAGGSSSVDISK
jgi:hypothetical protein